MATVNLLGLDSGGAAGLLRRRWARGRIRAQQLMRWIHHAGVDDFGAMTDIAKALRERLAAGGGRSRRRAVLRDTTAPDGTRKWLLDVGHGQRDRDGVHPRAGRGTLCISSQAGCALECTFCSTGRQGFNRNLAVGRDHRPAVARQSRCSRREQRRRAADHERRDDGHGRAARTIRQRRRPRCSSCSTTSPTGCRAGA